MSANVADTIMNSMTAGGRFYKDGVEILSVDVIEKNRLVGWYHHEAGVGSSLTVMVNGYQAANLVATSPREDVARSDYAVLNCGFDITLLQPLTDDCIIEIVSSQTQRVLFCSMLGLEKPEQLHSDLDRGAKRALSLDASADLLTRVAFGGRQLEAVGTFEGTEPVAIIPDDGKAMVLFDISDLVYYLGHHDNLTGIQRVQSCILLALLRNKLHPLKKVIFLSYAAEQRDFVVIPQHFMLTLLDDLIKPTGQRRVTFSKMQARVGLLPGCQPLEKVVEFDTDSQAVVCLLGAAWVSPDYFRRVADLKRRCQCRFVMTIHDLIPIYARETCDQGTAIVFEQFMNRAIENTDVFLSVSDNTRADLERYCRSIERSVPPVVVTQNGSSFAEFFPRQQSRKTAKLDVTGPFVLFVSTIEGRKNHRFAFNVWRRLVELLDDAPTLVCVGRLGWRAEEFLGKLVETNYLDHKVVLKEDISDAELDALYEGALFTIYPSLYEGWGLPVGESLEKGKICVTSTNSSLPEVGGEYCVYIDIDDVEKSVRTVHDLIVNRSVREEREARIKSSYAPIQWQTVAERVLRGCEQALLSPPRQVYPTLEVGKEYKFVRSDRANQSMMGHDMLTALLEQKEGLLLDEAVTESAMMAVEASRHGNSWYVPEHWGTWSAYPKSEFRFLINADDVHKVVIFLLAVVPGPLVGSKLRLRSHGNLVQAVKISEPKMLLRLPATVRKVEYGPMVSLEAEFEHSKETQRRLNEIDKRELGLGVISMVVSNQSDHLVRQIVTERLIFGENGAVAFQ
jgi:glycosyltransferase involved in cell wall biosynthesis